LALLGDENLARIGHGWRTVTGARLGELKPLAGLL
jgi:hypothetical protein